ncbi:TIGR03085 family protein [Streptoalloteichus tenebrarius]|uniref:TIGR03085 family protein n=1 Tax=Streptoalloteichus tenebrarius (strain ATCC 17920 / DSM 40477 / JCM 4838 / CBS 697.72 / NBRC 16177 / NCIMB 11028 / NRRL B-12390 / A12253. 1 / ISP 5477) TaxID=1933 RepID=A0ABT1HN57_STRSD|nr:TIGR03085 family metal-binding protein [Streptoalloteichus tenebrarius]MCP2256925.1 TIGR03085 family protein [Streptoalloteichus tenebrarius]BFF00166.1 TIGR03085 family metal-binding protein [Streptoalloteichus tenebrarius]
MGVARDERRQLCDLLDRVGPDEPTLCAGWRTRDLAAHLVLRERRPDASPGIVLRPLAGYTALVQRRLASRPWGELVRTLRQGPPRWSPFAIPGVDEAVNGTEFFVHHEDVRRAREGWAPRPADPARDAMAWRALARIGRLTFRRCPVGVALRRPNGEEVLARRGPRAVTVVGAPGELLLYAFGREAVEVEFEGDQADVQAVRGLRRGL